MKAKMQNLSVKISANKKPSIPTMNNCVCEVCSQPFYSPKPRRAKTCSDACRSIAYRSRKKTTDNVKFHTMNLDEYVDLKKIEIHSKIAAGNLRQIMAMYGRDAYELALDATWEILVICGGLRIEEMK